MTLTLYALAALCVGLGSAVQVAMVASLGRLRGSTEATWISLLGTLLGLAVVFGARSLLSDPPSLPSPFRQAGVFALIAVVAAAALAISVRGLNPYLAVSGMFGFTYLVSAALIAPRAGVALFTAAVTAGTLLGSVLLDHLGAFGGEVHRVNAARVAGIIALLIGVALVRGR